jgi:hypothetical protein
MARYSKSVGIAILLLVIILKMASAQDVIDVIVKGISDNSRDGAQKDRQEAIMDAKRQACEKAGLKIEAKTTVENFQTVYDYVESQAAAILLPGFQVIDNGYGEDGTYTVVLVGKVRTGTAPSGDLSQFTVIIWFKDNEDVSKDMYYYIDKLYDWLNMIHGKILVNDKSLDTFENRLIQISKCDSTLYGDRYAIAYQYNFPAGNFIYTQRTPNTDRTVSKHDFEIKLRAGKKYVMDAAHDNAVYFNKPKRYDQSVINKRLYGKFPDNFMSVFQKP